MMDFTELLQALAGILGTVITLYLIPWIKSITTERQQRVIMEIASVAVRAAEQLYNAGDGEQKLQYALKRAELVLASKGIKVDTDLVRMYIEEQVCTMNEHKNLNLLSTKEAEPLLAPLMEETITQEIEL